MSGLSTVQIILAVIMILASLFLSVTILLQSGAQQGLSGSIAGGAETFFGSGKAKGMDAVLSKVTVVVAILFVVLAVVMNIVK